MRISILCDRGHFNKLTLMLSDEHDEHGNRTNVFEAPGRKTNLEATLIASNTSLFVDWLVARIWLKKCFKSVLSVKI